MGRVSATYDPAPWKSLDECQVLAVKFADGRERFARHLERVWMFRDPAERSGRFAELGRNFVQRLGDVALIGLDTGKGPINGKCAAMTRPCALR